MHLILNNAYRLLAHIFCVFIFYTLFRTGFLIFNSGYFSDLNLKILIHLFINGFRFDISSILVINSLFVFLFLFPFVKKENELYQKILKFIFITTNSIAFLFELGDWMYFPFNHKRSTAEVLNMISRKGDFLALLPSFIKDFWYIFLIAIGFIFLLIKSYTSIVMYFKTRRALFVFVNPKSETRNKISLYSLQISIFLIAIGGSVIGIRGGLQFIPINLRNAVEVSKSEYAPILLNTPFSIINSFSNAYLERKSFMSDEEAKLLVQPIKKYPAVQPFQKKNVVVIILESFSKEFTMLGPGKSYTPFLDSLMKQGLTFTNAFANGLHSAEGIPAIIAGIPSLMSESFSVSAYSTNTITALPSLLQPLGYNSAFFHGASNGSMSFDIFAKSAGYNQYFGRTEYNNEADYDGSWGIFDEPFLQFFADQMSHQKQPFFNTVFTVTSHSPYPIPKKYKNKFPNDGLDVQSTLLYTDFALRRFFETIRKEAWFENTLFIITADHCSPMSSNTYYANGTGRYQIPVVFYAPNDAHLKGFDSTLMEQIDILPSVLDYLNYSKSFYSLGNSVFQKQVPRFVMNQLSDVDYWINAGQQMVMINDEVREVYAFPQDSLRQKNLLNQDGYSINQESFRLWQAAKQVYTNSLIENKMTVNSTK